MDDESFKALIESHRHTQRMIGRLEFFVGLIFFATVIAPLLQHFGWWNLAGW